MFPKRGEVFWSYLDPTLGSEQSGRRPVLIIQNNDSNEFANTTIVAPLTSKIFSDLFPTHVLVKAGVLEQKFDSTILLSQIRTIDKSRLKKKIGHLAKAEMQKVDQAIKISLALI